MFMQYDSLPAKLDEEFSLPVESIMRCENFKSNFARRLSNRYIIRTPSIPKQDNTLKLRPQDAAIIKNTPDKAPERIEQCTQLSKSSVTEQNGEGVKPPDKKTTSDIRRTEVTALNMEVETLRWQLAQTEANRQMHIGLLKQIVTFLHSVKDHIECQKTESPKKEIHSRILPQSFNIADLPRSKSALHVNKNLDFTTPPRKISTKKISKSISNVDGFKDCQGLWNQSKLSLMSEMESSQKISQEMSRLITLANTVLSTKLPDLACTCNNNNSSELNSLTSINLDKDLSRKPSNSYLNLIEEDPTNAFILNTICDSEDTSDCITNKFIDLKNDPSSFDLENDFSILKLNDKERHESFNVSKNESESLKKAPNISNFIEDESGFSSMSSFQDIGIPIINIIPPSPCREVYIEGMSDILDSEKWKTNTLELEKQTMKVFWV
ncbi:uncharacterized protein LOC106130537 [Amyelois transitella]|uniref:uncharacterized protein LOC106130537 n=1 Tax=Amyelois transitella TaxID=680683 RepID=UPI00067B6F2C|nr:uncharacterized protein LOC106130537 [Amyelois transitella]